MKQLVITALLALTGMGAQAQTSETRKSENFNALEVKNGIEVIFTQSDQPSLKVESDSQDNLEDIVTEYRKGILKIYMREPKNEGVTRGIAKVYVSAGNVTNFKAVTGASVKVNGKLTVDDLTVKLASGASFAVEAHTKKCFVKAESGAMFRGNITTSAFDGKLSGGASMKISGSTETASAWCNNGALMAGKFLCQRADVKTMNASTAFISASESITADADNSSSITYYGEPADVNLGTNMYAIKRDNLKLALNN